MEIIYNIVGKVIVWGVIICVAGFIVFIALAFIGVKIYNFFDSDWFKYFLGRTYETELIRAAYKNGLNKSQRKIAAKYRLRNIKNAKV